MTDWSPPRFPRNWLLLVSVLFALWVVYAVIVIQQLLLGLVPLFVFAFVYLGWRLLAALEAIADAQQRLADQGERGDD